MTDQISSGERAAMRALTGAASAEPWAANADDEQWAAISSGPDAVIHAYAVHDATCEGCECSGQGAAAVAISPEDAAFIVAMRTFVPRLLDENERLLAAASGEGLTRAEVIAEEHARLRQKLAAKEAEIRCYVDFDKHRDECVGLINGLRDAERFLTASETPSS